MGLCLKPYVGSTTDFLDLSSYCNTEKPLLVSLHSALGSSDTKDTVKCSLPVLIKCWYAMDHLLKMQQKGGTTLNPWCWGQLHWQDLEKKVQEFFKTGLMRTMTQSPSIMEILEKKQGPSDMSKQCVLHVEPTQHPSSLQTWVSNYKAIVFTSLLYGLKTWISHRKHCKQLEGFHMDSPRPILTSATSCLLLSHRTNIESTANSWWGSTCTAPGQS